MADTKNQRWSLKGKTALVTGGSRGIGRAIVEELAEFGATVHTCCRREEDLDKCLKEWEEMGFKVSGSVCDVQNTEQRNHLMETVSSLFNATLNILVNNAGKASSFKRAAEVTEEEIWSIMSTNYEASYHLSQLAYPLLKASGNGSIVFISSISGIVALPNSTPYAASKAAINQITKNLACEWAKDKIRTNSVAPWIIKTGLVEPHNADPGFVKGREQLLSVTPLRRPGEPHEVSSMVAFLCLPAASYITGQLFVVDGGHSVKAYPFPDM